MDFEENLKRLRAEYGEASGGEVRDPKFRRSPRRSSTRRARASRPMPASRPSSPRRSAQIDWNAPDFSATSTWRCSACRWTSASSNRNGARFGPRAVRTIERIGPYNHVLECAPDLRPADGGHRRHPVPQPLQPRTVARGHRAAYPHDRGGRRGAALGRRRPFDDAADPARRRPRAGRSA